MQKIPLLLSVFFDSNDQTKWTLPCHPDAYWFGGRDGGYFLEIKHEIPPNYYVAAYNEKGSVLFKGSVMVTQNEFNYNSILRVRNEYVKNINSWFIVLKDNNVLSVKPELEKEFLNDKG